MAGTIKFGSPEHQAHLIGVDRDKTIAENQPKIKALKEQLKTANLEYNTATPEELATINKQKQSADISGQINELEHPKVSEDVLKGSRQVRIQVLDARFKASEITPAEYKSQCEAILAESNTIALPQNEIGTVDFKTGVNLAKSNQPLPVNSSQATKDGFKSVSTPQ